MLGLVLISLVLISGCTGSRLDVNVNTNQNEQHYVSTQVDQKFVDQVNVSIDVSTPPRKLVVVNFLDNQQAITAKCFDRQYNRSYLNLTYMVDITGFEGSKEIKTLDTVTIIPNIRLMHRFEEIYTLSKSTYYECNFHSMIIQFSKTIYYDGIMTENSTHFILPFDQCEFTVQTPSINKFTFEDSTIYSYSDDQRCERFVKRDDFIGTEMFYDSLNRQLSR